MKGFFCQFIQFRCVWSANIIEKPSDAKLFLHGYLRPFLPADMITENDTKGTGELDFSQEMMSAKQSWKAF